METQRGYFRAVATIALPWAMGDFSKVALTLLHLSVVVVEIIIF